MRVFDSSTYPHVYVPSAYSMKTNFDIFIADVCQARSLEYLQIDGEQNAYYSQGLTLDDMIKSIVDAIITFNNRRLKVLNINVKVQQHTQYTL